MMQAELDGRAVTVESPGDPLFASGEWREIAESLRLSPREVQIIKGVFKDSKEVAIANHLDISPHTVHTYLERIYRKLEVNSRVQMVVRIFMEYLQLANNGHK